MTKTLLATFALLLAPLALAHETQTVGEGDGIVEVTVGFASEPAYTDERNGPTVSVRDADGEPVTNLEGALAAELVAPGGASLSLDLRAVHGQPGTYSADLVLTEAGVYTLQLDGFIGATEIDLAFELHEVAPLDDLRFP